MTAGDLQRSDKTHAAILTDDGYQVFEVDKLHQNLGVDELIRLHMSDFTEFQTLSQKYTHFNLQKTLNEVGMVYGILPIVQAGYRDSEGREVIPVCDATQFRKGLCVEVLQEIQIHDVPLEYYQFSLPSIRCPEELQEALVLRYSRLFPNISEEQLLKRGCAISVLKLEA